MSETQIRPIETTNSDEYFLSAIDKYACDVIDNAFGRNSLFWKPDHNRQHRLFNMIMGAAVPDKEEDPDRSHIKLGITWMVHQLIFAILKNSLLTLAKNIKLDTTVVGAYIKFQVEMEQYLDRLISDVEWPVAGSLRQALFDLVSHGNAVGRPYYKHDLRPVFIDGQDFEMLNYSGPMIDFMASWDVYPTAGATCFDELHEVIFYEWYYPHELRAMERAGLIENVDWILRDHHEPDFSGKQDYEKNNPRESHASAMGDDAHGQLTCDASGRIGVLVYWGLFPIYKEDEYIGDDGRDRSKDEVECLIIKPVGRNCIMRKERNPHFSQRKAAIFAKYFDIPGLFWGESIFGVMERLFVFQEDLSNIIQDSANNEVYRDRVISTAISGDQLKQKGAGRDYVVDKETFKDMNGNVLKYVERGPSVLGDIYQQRDYYDRIIMQVSGIRDFLQAVAGDVEKTKFEVEQLVASTGLRFEQCADEVGNSLLVHSVAWMVSLLSSQDADDQFIGRQCGTAISWDAMGKPIRFINPFKQFTPMMPNPSYRIRLEGTKRAVQAISMQQELTEMIELARTIPPGTDENGNPVAPDLFAMFVEDMKLSRSLKETEKFIKPWVPPPVVVDPSKEAASVPGA